MNKIMSFVVEERNPQKELPDDVLRIIREYSRPIWTRPDWRFCGYRESNIMMRYHEWEHELWGLNWNRLSIQVATRVDDDIIIMEMTPSYEDIKELLFSTRMIKRLIEFEQGYHTHMVPMRYILKEWFGVAWRAGLVLL